MNILFFPLLLLTKDRLNRMSLAFVATPSNANLCSFGDCCFLHLQSLSHRSEWISWNFHQLQRMNIATFNTYKLNLFSCNFEKIYLGKWKSRNGPQPTVKKTWKPKAAAHPVCQTPGTPVCCVISQCRWRGIIWHQSNLVTVPSQAWSTPSQENGLCQ